MDNKTALLIERHNKTLELLRLVNEVLKGNGASALTESIDKHLAECRVPVRGNDSARQG